MAASLFVTAITIQTHSSVGNGGGIEFGCLVMSALAFVIGLLEGIQWAAHPVKHQ